MVPGYSDFLPQSREMHVSLNKKCEWVFGSGVDGKMDGNASRGSGH